MPRLFFGAMDSGLVTPRSGPRVRESGGPPARNLSCAEREMGNPTLESLLGIGAAMGIDLVEVLRQAKRAEREWRMAFLRRRRRRFS
jgi:hypothetical protein